MLDERSERSTSTQAKVRSRFQPSARLVDRFRGVTSHSICSAGYIATMAVFDLINHYSLGSTSRRCFEAVYRCGNRDSAVTRLMARHSVLSNECGGYVIICRNPQDPDDVLPESIKMTSPNLRAGQPFTGVSVIEIGGTVAAAGATKTLADFGADVIKLEPMTGGEIRRLPPFPDDTPHVDRGAYHLALDSGKRSLAVDLSTLSGVQVLLDLSTGVDAVVMHLPPREARSLLTALATLGSEAPTSLVMTPHGLEGPLADNEEDDISVFARTNRMLRHSFTGEEPLRYAPYVPTLQWAATATAVLLAAIWGRRNDGERRSVEVAAVEALSGNVDSWYVPWTFNGVDPPRGPETRLGYPNGYLRCSDGLLAFSAGTAPFFSRLCDAIGQPQLATDPRFTDPLEKPKHYDEFMHYLKPYLAARTRYQAFTELQEYGVMCAPLLDIAEAIRDPQAVARGSFVEVEQQSGIGEITLAGPPFRLRDASPIEPWQIRSAPTFGQHMAELLTEAGYSRAEQIALFRAGVTS
jgi:crotonobetainyl-CoA:carnitine CoA-transferase CaiB-like acyl-CoA transferase